MGQPVDANGRSVIHQGHGMTHVCAVPDVCKTPTPAGPVPIPYPNLAMDSNLTDGATSVQIEGNPVANVGSKIATSTGDEPGSVGGIMSNVVKGTMTWKMGSLDVKAEGKSVVRFMDTAFHNGNSFNSSWMNLGGAGLAYADDFEGNCPICGKEPHEHRILSKKSTAELCAQIIRKLREQYDTQTDDQGKGRYAKPARNDKGEVIPGAFQGYMVGVMICLCNKSFAAMSGENLPGFEEVAAQFVDKVIPGGPVSARRLANANTSTKTLRKASAAIAKAFDRINTLKAQQPPPQGYSYPGVCAAAKLLAKSGHSPTAMTESFSMFRRGAFKYNVLSVEEWVNRGRIRRDFSSEGPIASCHTCQETLFMTMCPERVCP